MRLGTIATIAALALSGAALAQVASTPDEDKLTPSNEQVAGNDMLLNDNALAGPPAASGDTGVDDDPLSNATVEADLAVGNDTRR